MADQVVKAMCVLHSYLTQDGDNNVQALLNAGIEVRNDGLQDLANVWWYHATHAPIEVRNYFKDYFYSVNGMVLWQIKQHIYDLN